MNCKNILFDFDGTLVDTAELIVATIRTAARELQLPDKTEAECRSVIGLRLEEVADVLWPQHPGMSERYAACYRRIFEALKPTYPVRCFPQVVETLQQLRAAGFRMAIASSRNRPSLTAYLDEFGLAGHFCMLVGGNDVAHGKPAPDPVLAILEAQQWQADESWVVGDMAVDILMGRRAGTHTCGVTYGNGSRDELTEAGAEAVISDFADLVRVVSR